MLLLVIINILLGVIGIINVSLCEKLNRIEIILDIFSKRYGLIFSPNDNKDVKSSN